MTPHDFLFNLALALGVAGLGGALFQRLGQPAVLGYLVAGILVGPNVPVPLFADSAVVSMLSELGVILLMFHIGLELPLRRVFQVAGTGGIVALIEVSALFGLGAAAAHLLGWTGPEQLFAGALVSISSTSLIARIFEDRGEKGPVRDLVFGVLVVEDLLAIALLTALATVGGGGELALGDVALKLGGIIVGLLTVGLLVVPRLVRALGAGRPEVLVVGSVGLCFGMALLAAELGASVALGAFLAGALAAESGLGHELGERLAPVRDVFGALFFVSVGMLFDPAVVWEHAPAVLALFGVVVLGKVLAVGSGAFLAGSGLSTSVKAGFTMANIGEFSFILAGLGLSSGATRGFLLPVAVAVAVLTAFTTPYLVRASERVAHGLDRRLPGPLQTLMALYTAWIEQLRAPGAPPSRTRTLRRLIGFVVIDALALIAVAVGHDRLGPELAQTLGLEPELGRWVVAGGAILVATPLIAGLALSARRVAALLTASLLPAETAAHWPAAQRLAEGALTLGAGLAIGLPVVAATAPFLPPFGSQVLFAVLVGTLSAIVWRQATALQGEIGAGAGLVLGALLRRATNDQPAHPHVGVPTPLAALGEPVAVVLPRGCAAVGHTLIELNLRARTGATVLAIQNDKGETRLPNGREPLQEGDVLVLAGTREAEDAATAVLLQSAVT